MENGIKSLVSDVQDSARIRYHKCENLVRRSPGKAILTAAAAGWCLHRLPVRSILVANVRLAAALTPPLLLAFGAAKLCEFLQNQARATSKPDRLDSDLIQLR